MKKTDFTDNDIKKIISMYKNGDTYRVIAEPFGVHVTTIAVVINNLIDEARMKQRPQRTSRTPVKKVRRPCLKCRRQFLSEGAHNRICLSCKKTNNDCYNHPFAKEVSAAGTAY